MGSWRKGYVTEELFRFWVEQGWRYRRRENLYMQWHLGEYRARVKREVGVIFEKDFVDYFLIVSDLVRWAKDNGIAVGPGRGSSVGSLVCYLLRITEVDSMQFPVLFERFLDESRTDPPDIDIDFEDTRRDDVFRYAATKYGVDQVANIGTVTRYKGRNSLDDVGRVYHIPHWKLDMVKGKLLDRAEGHPRFMNSLEDTYNSFEDISELVDKTPQLKYAAQLEGNVRNFGVHAAGIVISSVPINDICATYEKRIGERQGAAIAFDKYDASYLGLLKIDFLSLSTLGMLAEICRMIGKPWIDLYRIPLTDKGTLQAFADGDVLGVFQFEGMTTRRILKQVVPTTFMHLSDVNALARPGAQDREYIKNKQLDIGGAPIQIIKGVWANPIVSGHLSWTYGVVVYEEQILLILRDLGGFEPKELNRIRKVIHDKLGGTAFNEYYERFVEGAARQQVSEEDAKEIWEGLVSASGYAFNIAHSVSYTHIGYWSMWLKIHYRPQFYAAALLKCEDVTDPKERDSRRAKLIQEAERHGIKVIPPNLGVSQANWSAVGTNIVAGLSCIPTLGPKRVESIIKWRNDIRKSMSRLPSKVPIYEVDWSRSWDRLVEISGIGPGTVTAIKKFLSSDDVFNVGYTQRILNAARKELNEGKLLELTRPTHISVDIPLDGQLVTFMGIVKSRKYYDAAEQLSKREIGMTYQEAYERLSDPHLLKYAALYCEDEYGEQVRVAISRWRYPQYAQAIGSIKLGSDVVVAEGHSSDFQGISVQVKRMWVLEV